MRNGFIFNINLCVNCKSCSAACLLENNWSEPARTILTYNTGLYPDLPVTHLSMACNHCLRPLCLESCPTGAYNMDPSSSAIILDETRCIGCSYCIWNCPYDAPKLNSKKGFIEKCNFCNPRIQEGLDPACTAACPTGALSFGKIPETGGDMILEWMPGKEINPGLMIKGSEDRNHLKIYPEAVTGALKDNFIRTNKNTFVEWSLILFSFLAVISVSFNISIFLGGKAINMLTLIIIMALAGITSLFHLGVKRKAWKAILNIKSSPLSREIAIFITYSILTCIALLVDSRLILLISAITGLILLLAIDSVYRFADKSTLMLFHSGQTFLTGLLISSFLLSAAAPFIFIASLKILVNLNRLIKQRQQDLFPGLRRVRICILLIISAALISGKAGNDATIFFIFLSGEFFDRILYYADFNPVSIDSEITKHLILSQNEKERD